MDRRDRREESRVSVSLPVSWSQGDRHGLDLVEDLSDRGMFLLTSADLAIGESIELQLDADGAPVAVAARVVRPESRRGQVVGFGLRFEALDDRDRRALSRVVRQHRYRFALPDVAPLDAPLESAEVVVDRGRGLVIAATVILMTSVALIGAAAWLLS